MKKENMRFGTYLKTIRSEREITLKMMAEELGISLSFLSDVEQNRRKPFDSDKLGKIAEYLRLNDEEKALLYDLAAREKGTVPDDIDDIMMHSEVGDMARLALRLTNAGVIGEADWKKFIRDIERQKERSES